MSELSDAERSDRLKLARTENVGPVTFDQLLQRFGTAARALEALPELARRGGRNIKLASEAAVDRELTEGAALGARLIASCEAAFPSALAALDPPPPVLWARGRVEILGRSSVAVVGARVASAAGQRFARGLASELGQAGQVSIPRSMPRSTAASSRAAAWSRRVSPGARRSRATSRAATGSSPACRAPWSWWRRSCVPAR